MVADSSAVGRYIELGLRLGRHIDGMVDAYYGPPEVAARVGAEPVQLPARLAADARQLVADLDAGADPGLELRRRAWLRAQVLGLHTTARKLAGEAMGYLDEVEACYGVRPEPVPDDELSAAHRRLDAVLPGSGPLAERYVTWREAHAVPTDKLRPAIDSLTDDLRERTQRLFGLPEGEHIDFELVTNEPWSGFNYYLGDLRSRVAINTDLPVLSLTLAHLVAHEAYPGHHTEHVCKDTDLIGPLGRIELGVYVYPTPQVVVAEGIAQLGLEALLGAEADAVGAQCLRPLGIAYDIATAATYRRAEEMLLPLGANVAMLLDDGRSADEMRSYARRWALQDDEFIDGYVESLISNRWPAYESCYAESLPLCRRFVAGDAHRFQRLLGEQLTPRDLDGQP
jgi:hypothetical protein